MKYIIEVNREMCIACAACYNTDPVHYHGDDDGKSVVENGTTNGISKGIFDDNLRDDAQRAADSCPVSAIAINKIN